MKRPPSDVVPTVLTLALAFVVSAGLTAWHGLPVEVFCLVWIVAALVAILAALSGERPA